MTRKQYQAPHHYSQRELDYAVLRDLANDIRCARRDHCEANPLLAYADKCAAMFKTLWAVRHQYSN